MAASRKHILSTGLLDDALIGQINATHEIDVIPFINVASVMNWELETEVKKMAEGRLHVVFTSSNAVKSVAAMLGKGIATWQVFSVEGTTSKAVADKFGEASLKGTAYAGQELADEILKHEDVREVVFFCGDLRRDELPQRLREKGIGVREVVVYKTVATPMKVSRNYDAILFFSPSAVHSFFKKNALQEETVCFAIGNTTANAIKELVNNKVVTAYPPQKEQVVKMLLEYYT